MSASQIASLASECPGSLAVPGTPVCLGVKVQSNITDLFHKVWCFVSAGQQACILLDIWQQLLLLLDILFGCLFLFPPQAW